ncbi:toxin [Candidatus Roizmanbacteria bacterium]|nr:toxin [Candidatus Roizmanbacteria bacterium]
MNLFRFNEEKDKSLKSTRGVGFKTIIREIKKGNIIEVIDNPNKKRYPNQKLYLIRMKNHVVVVPYIEEVDSIFLKTFFPSQKYTKKYLSKKLKVKK